MTAHIDLGYQPRPQFVAFHARKQRWACIVAHRRAGKSVACIMDLVDAALRCKKPDGRFGYVAPTFTQAKDVVWSYLKYYTHQIPQTGLLPEDELESARRTLTPEQFAQEFECSFDAAIVGAYFAREIADAETAGRICDVPVDPELPVHTAWDLGIGDSTAIWFYQVVGKEIHAVDCYEANGKGLAHYAAVLEDKGYNYGTDWLPHDGMAREMGTGRSRFETLKDLTGRHPRIVRNLSVADGINAARLTIGSAWFDADKCHNGLEALRAYRADYDERAKVFHDRPGRDWASHSADSFRYLAVAWREMQPEKPPPPPVDTWERAWRRADQSEVEGWRVA